MLTIEVVKCSSSDHKLRCLNEAIEAVRRARCGNATRNGRKVTIRGAITDPCGCHLDALIWMASDLVEDGGYAPYNLADATTNAYQRHARREMH